MISRHFSYSALLLGFALTSCGYAIEKTHQDFTLLTPGAENARCFVYVDKIKYQIYPPDTIDIMKSENDMEIYCEAPGNRNREMTVEPNLTQRALWGGPPGMAWDYASKALYHYPSVVAIDFSQEETKLFDLPKHNSGDLMRPEDHLLDEISPSEPRLNADRDAPKTELKRRAGMVDEPENLLPEEGESTDTLGDIIEQLHATMPQAGDYVDIGMETDPEADGLPVLKEQSGPVQLYPGQ